MAASYYKDLYQYLTKRYPNTKVYIISDHHFYHDNIIQYGRDQFSDVNEMNQFIVKSHNDVVTDNDIVLFLGDFSFKKNENGSLLSKMNGHKFLMLGNHDKMSLTRCYADMGFEGIFVEPVKFENDYLSHQPLNDPYHQTMHYQLLLGEFNKSNGINYHGHIHTTENPNDNYFNVCCEALDYKPFLIGNTGCEIKNDDVPLLIESPVLNECIKILGSEKNFTPMLLITDYIYSLMLEASQDFVDSICLYGSYPQYKKYGYVSNFGDLDVAVLYDEEISKSKNSQKLKNYVDKIYATLINIDGIDLEYIKRFINMCAFGYLYTNNSGVSCYGALDVNLVPVNFYRSCDFVKTTDISTIEKFLSKKHDGLLDGCRMPKFEANFLKTNGDIANLILQALYQKGNKQRRDTALKKIRYIAKYFGSSISLDDSVLENTLIRFFLRNITFFQTLKRNDDIDFLKTEQFNLKLFIGLLPTMMKDKIGDILLDPQSDYNRMFEEIKDTPNKEIVNKCRKLVKQL